MDGYRVITDHPIATSSPDYLVPKRERLGWGFTSSGLIQEILTWGGEGCSLMDLGCGTGTFVVDAADSGIDAIGIDGSDLYREREEWKEHENSRLFLADVCKPFLVQKGGRPAQFHVVSAWETLEHLPEDRLLQFFIQLRGLLRKDGVFIGSSREVHDQHGDVDYHLTVRPKDWWESAMEGGGLVPLTYPFRNNVRPDCVEAGGFLLAGVPQ